MDQVRLGAASGALKPGIPLPTIRPLAERLHLNRNTVAKAYAALETLGFIQTIPGKGSFIKKIDSSLNNHARNLLVTRKIDEALIAAHQAQVDPADFLAIAQERLQFFTRQNAAQPVPTPSAGATQNPATTAIPSKRAARLAGTDANASAILSKSNTMLSRTTSSPESNPMAGSSGPNSWGPTID